MREIGGSRDTLQFRDCILGRHALGEDAVEERVEQGKAPQVNGTRFHSHEHEPLRLARADGGGETRRKNRDLQFPPQRRRRAVHERLQLIAGQPRAVKGAADADDEFGLRIPRHGAFGGDVGDGDLLGHVLHRKSLSRQAQESSSPVL